MNQQFVNIALYDVAGHRSQASPEVRHISGQHGKEFRDFLVRYPDTFVVGEETVMLKEWEGQEPQPFHELEQVTL
jgi:exonuclease 3'-5' domain-containing protein 1